MTNFVLFLLCVFAGHALVCGEQISGYFDIIEGRKSLNITNSLEHVSQLTCVSSLMASRNVGGITVVSYDGTSQTCQLSTDTREHTGSVSDAKWKTFIPISGM